MNYFICVVYKMNSVHVVRDLGWSIEIIDDRFVILHHRALRWEQKYYVFFICPCLLLLALTLGWLLLVFCPTLCNKDSVNNLNLTVNMFLTQCKHHFTGLKQLCLQLPASKLELYFQFLMNPFSCLILVLTCIRWHSLYSRHFQNTLLNCFTVNERKPWCLWFCLMTLLRVRWSIWLWKSLYVSKLHSGIWEKQYHVI